MKVSNLERKFLKELEYYGLAQGIACEYKFASDRRWRFDFAWPDKLVACEIEGGLWNRGRHMRPIGFINDCEKYNMATEMGWKVFRYAPPAIADGSAYEQLKRVLK